MNDATVRAIEEQNKQIEEAVDYLYDLIDLRLHPHKDRPRAAKRPKWVNKTNENRFRVLADAIVVESYK